MNKNKIVAVLRILIGMLVLTAIGIQIFQLAWLEVFNPGNFFSYFTNLGNLFAAIVFIATGFRLFSGQTSSTTEDLVRGANTLFMATTGIVYVTLLSQYELGLLVPWVNTVLHYIMPLAVVLDWLVLPPRTKISLPQSLVWLVVPFVFVGYSLVRGAHVNWYPYPFLDPAQVGGYGKVALYCAGIAVFVFALTLLIRWVGNWLGQRIPAGKRR